MKLEQQVCSLELAKRLKELGVKQVSEFWWIEMHDGSHRLLSHWDTANRKGYSAFTVAELGEMLPVGTWTLKRDNHQEVGESWGQLCNWLTHKGKRLRTEESDTEADARAKMLIYLLDNKLIELPKEQEAA